MRRNHRDELGQLGDHPNGVQAGHAGSTRSAARCRHGSSSARPSNAEVVNQLIHEEGDAGV